MCGKPSRLLGPKWTHIESWKLDKGYDIKDLVDVLLKDLLDSLQTMDNCNGN